MSTPNPWLDRLIGGTRQEVIDLLLRADRTVQEIAEVIGVSTNAIRGHLAALERDRLVVQSGTRRDTGGKPAAVYSLSPAADELFPKAYATVLEQLLALLDERDGPAQVRDTLAQVGVRAARPAEGTPRERVVAAAKALRSLGGTVEVRREGDHWKIQGFACPLSAITAHDERVCGLAESLVSTTSGGEVVEVCERGERSRCGFTITFPDDSDASSL